MADVQGGFPNEAINFINGEFIAPVNGVYEDIIGPRDGKKIGRVGISGASDVQTCVEAAVAAFQKWKLWTVKERMKPLLKLRHLLEERENELAEIIMLEHGKNRVEALGSIRKGNETVEYACGMPALLAGRVLEVSNGVKCEEHRYPHGVCVSIVPFNFPIMVPLWTMPIALACGNCIILKPSEKVPLTTRYMFELIQECGFPKGVVQCINGKVDAVNALCDHEGVKAVTFVGSTKVAQIVSRRCRAMDKRCVALGGAKNHLIAVNDCNINMTSTDVLNSFCGCSGQRCMAAANLLLVGENAELMEAIVTKVSNVKPGKEKYQMGPLIDQAAQDRCKRYVDQAEKNGAKVLVDGRKWSEEMKEGFWFGPTVLLLTDPKDPSLHDEIFGPILSVIVVNSDDDAIAFENANPYGNAACIYTSSGGTAEWYRKRMSAGMLGVNIGVPVPREPFAFGGINASKFGDFDITADGGMEFFTWRQKCTSKWAPPKKKTWMD